MRTPVAVVVEGLLARTDGMMSRCDLPEVAASVKDPSLLAEAEALLRYVIDYMTTESVVVRPEETLAYGYWLVKFRDDGAGGFELWEYDAEATHFVRGAELTLRYWRDQHELCSRFGARFMPPRPDQLAVMSDGVLENDPVQGVRYPSPEQMSGWWITTDRYDGNIKSLRREHLYHLTAARPDLARFVALPYGFRFDTANGEDVWFEEAVAHKSI